MADSLRTRVARVIAGSAHLLLDKIEDASPVAVLEQSARELDQLTEDVRVELGRAVANRHLTQLQHLHLNQEHDNLSASLGAALAVSRDDLAKPAIARQLDIEAQLPILESSLGELTQNEKELASYVEALMGKKREMEQAIGDFEASRRTAKSTAAAGPRANSSVGARLDAVQDAFDRTYHRQTGLKPVANNATLAQATKLRELNELVRDNKVNERLAALKLDQ